MTSFYNKIRQCPGINYQIHSEIQSSQIKQRHLNGKGNISKRNELNHIKNQSQTQKQSRKSSLSKKKLSLHFQDKKQFETQDLHKPIAVLLKMNICGKNFCEINIQNTCKFQQSQKNGRSQSNADSRIIYVSQKINQKRQMQKQMSISQVPKFDFQINKNNHPESSFKQKNKLIEKQSQKYSFMKNDFNDNSDLKTNFQRRKYQFTYFNGPFEERNIMETSPSNNQFQSKNLKTNDNSFSIINFSVLGSVKNQQFNPNIQGRLNNNNSKQTKQIDKLRQIYHHTHQSSDSGFDQEYLKFQNFNFDQNNNINIENPNKQQSNPVIYLQEKFDSPFLKNSQLLSNEKIMNNQSNSARTIIDILTNLDSKSQFNFQRQESDKSQSQVNPQKNQIKQFKNYSDMRMLKKFKKIA